MALSNRSILAKLLTYLTNAQLPYTARSVLPARIAGYIRLEVNENLIAI